MLYELLTGRLPFEGPSAASIIHKIIYEDCAPVTKLRADRHLLSRLGLGLEGLEQRHRKLYEFPLFLSFIVRNGRAVLYPIYKGTFERRVTLPDGDPSKPNDSHAFRDYQIQLVKDFRRSVDYLESRPDVVSKKLAYYGMSWGGCMGGVIPAVEDRLQTSVLVASGFVPVMTRPEVRAINYSTA